jgi:hypothetical protein
MTPEEENTHLLNIATRQTASQFMQERADFSFQLVKLNDQLREIRWQQYVLLHAIYRLDPRKSDPEGGGANSPRFPPIPEDFK